MRSTAPTVPDPVRPRPVRRRVVRSGCAVAVLAAACVLGTGTPALAHDRLLSSTPEDGDRLDAEPTEIALSFSGDIMDIGAAVTVLDGDSRQVAKNDVAVDGPDVTRPLRPDLPEGGYAVRWRVVSADGHPISGSLTFTIGEHGAGPPTAHPVPEAARNDAARPPSSPASTGASSPWTRVLALACVGAVVGVAVLVVATAVAGRRRARTPSG